MFFGTRGGVQDLSGGPLGPYFQKSLAPWDCVDGGPSHLPRSMAAPCKYALPRHTRRPSRHSRVRSNPEEMNNPSLTASTVGIVRMGREVKKR